MKRLAFLSLIFVCTSVFAADLPIPVELEMGPVNLEHGGSMSLKWVTDCQAKVEAWKLSTQKKLISQEIVGTLQATAEFDLDTTYNREQDSSCTVSTTSLVCQVNANIEGSQHRIARMARTIKVSILKEDKLCDEILEQVKALPETLSAYAVIRERGPLRLRSNCTVVSLVVAKN